MTAGDIPDRTREQRLEALEEANRIRTYRAGRKRELASGRLGLADVLEDPDFATARLSKVILAMPKIGRVKANRALAQARISPTRTCDGLTGRQKLELMELLPEKRGARTRRALSDYPEAVLGSD